MPLRHARGLPAITAALKAPMDTPATISGRISASSSALDNATLEGTHSAASLQDQHGLGGNIFQSKFQVAQKIFKGHQIDLMTYQRFGSLRFLRRPADTEECT